MSHYERSKLADAIKEEVYRPGDFIIKQGETGDVFYIVIEGSAKATKATGSSGEATEVMKYNHGDYFGELALLKNEPRAANVVAETQLKVASLERHSFKRMLGPLEDIMKRNIEVYKNYV